MELIAEKQTVEIYFGVRALAILLIWEAMVAITLLQVIVTWISNEEPSDMVQEMRIWNCTVQPQCGRPE